jgi:two-component system alkaline phosphatase synthesis response regulator PhoP
MVEDDPNVAATLAERLRASGFEVSAAGSVATALRALDAGNFQLALLDVGLPDGSGLDVARHLQQHSPATAIVFLTAYGTPEDRIQGLELGADDYVTKPFVFRELLLRLHNALKRARELQQPSAATAGVVRIGRAEVDFRRFTARVGEELHPLTHKECAVLKLLAERPGVAVTRDEILDRAWSADEFPTQRTVDNFIVRLRRLVEKDPAHPRTIRSIRGVGYLFEAQGQDTR